MGRRGISTTCGVWLRKKRQISYGRFFIPRTSPKPLIGARLKHRKAVDE